jgi:glycosyltransferase involved in cell wall biosynthesis
MKIAILGSRGIPNAYGGFEQCAEYLSKGFVERGHEVWVYNSHNHPYQEAIWKGVNLIHKYDPEYKIGTVGQFVYDFNCILDSRKWNFDVILQLGYTSSSISGDFLPSKSIIVTNMDGLEWKRSKFSPKVQKFLKWAERKGITTSDCLISDSVGIQAHTQDTYGVDSYFIPYGAHPFRVGDESVLDEYKVTTYNYNMLVARLEPENNIETILLGVAKSNNSMPFLVIGKHETGFGNYLKEKFADDERIRFMGGIYNASHLDNLRFYSSHYFHGHSVGGTNPSLLEAMASQAFIVANDNIFNKAILEEDAFYFSTHEDVKKILETTTRNDNEPKVQRNLKRIEEIYEWNKIIDAYEKCLLEAFQKGKRKLKVKK